MSNEKRDFEIMRVLRHVVSDEVARGRIESYEGAVVLAILGNILEGPHGVEFVDMLLPAVEADMETNLDIMEREV